MEQRTQGLVVSVIAILVFSWATSEALATYLALRKTVELEQVTVETATLSGAARWIRLDPARWDCEHVVELERGAPESWLFGRVRETQIPVGDATGRMWMVIRFPEKVDCAEVSKEPVVGLLERDPMIGWVAYTIMDAHPQASWLLLRADESPASARNEVFGFLGFVLLSLLALRFFLRMKT